MKNAKKVPSKLSNFEKVKMRFVLAMGGARDGHSAHKEGRLVTHVVTDMTLGNFPITRRIEIQGLNLLES